MRITQWVWSPLTLVSAASSFIILSELLCILRAWCITKFPHLYRSFSNLRTASVWLQCRSILKFWMYRLLCFPCEFLGPKQLDSYKWQAACQLSCHKGLLSDGPNLLLKLSSAILAMPRQRVYFLSKKMLLMLYSWEARWSCHCFLKLYCVVPIELN